jgi:hypothetical protein
MPLRFVDIGANVRVRLVSGTRQSFSAKEDIMKSLIKAALISCALAAPVFAVAQTSAQANNGPLTRAEVRADLVRVEQAGYRPALNDIHYPSDIQAAEAKVAASNDALARNSVGGANASSDAGGGVQSAAPVTPGDSHSVYFGH